MPRELFSETVSHKYAPKRSKWTIAGSFVAHLVVLTALLVLPVLSALDNYVVHARNVAFIVPPPPVMPAIPAPPPAKAPPTTVPDVNPNAAPPSAPREPVTHEVTVPPAGPPAGREWVIGPPGVPPGLGTPESRVVIAAPPPPRSSDPIRVGGNISPPARLSHVEPIYPRIAIAAKVDGTVILEATVDESGAVKDVKVLRSIPLLDRAAIDAVKRWRYTPTRLNGIAVPILLTVTVTFTLR